MQLITLTYNVGADKRVLLQYPLLLQSTCMYVCAYVCAYVGVHTLRFHALFTMDTIKESILFSALFSYLFFAFCILDICKSTVINIFSLLLTLSSSLLFDLSNLTIYIYIYIYMFHTYACHINRINRCPSIWQFSSVNYIWSFAMTSGEGPCQVHTGKISARAFMKAVGALLACFVLSIWWQLQFYDTPRPSPACEPCPTAQ